MSRISNDDLDWDEWNRVGMACWVASAGSDAGHAAWHRWSSRSEKYDPVETGARWKHYFRSPPTGIGIGTLVHLATPRDPRDGAGDQSCGGDQSGVGDDDRDDGDDFSTILTAEEQARYFAGCVAVSGMGGYLRRGGSFSTHRNSPSSTADGNSFGTKQNLPPTMPGKRRRAGSAGAYRSHSPYNSDPISGRSWTDVCR